MWTTGSRAAAVLGLAVGISACGAGGLRHSDALPATRLVVRSQATSAPVTAEIEVDCATAPELSGRAAIASATAQRFQTVSAPGHDWTRTLDVAAGATCTAIDRPVPPGVLQRVTGGDPVNDGGRLTGVRATITGGDTVTVGLLAGVTT